MKKDNNYELFTSEVLSKGGESCLPNNLSDYWLHVLQEQADLILDDNIEDGAKELTAAIICILVDKNEDKESIEMPTKELYDCLESYQMELAHEELNRKTEIKYKPATLDTIFTNRNIKIWRDEQFYN